MALPYQDVGIRVSENWLQVPANSKLADDMREGGAEVRGLLKTSGSHGVTAFTYGLQWDDRDNEVSTQSGMDDTFDPKLRPGGTAALPYRYGQVDVTLRVFVPV